MPTYARKCVPTRKIEALLVEFPITPYLTQECLKTKWLSSFVFSVCQKDATPCYHGELIGALLLSSA